MKKYFLFLGWLFWSFFSHAEEMRNSPYMKSETPDTIHCTDCQKNLETKKLQGSVVTNDNLPLPIGRAQVQLFSSKNPKKVISEKTTDSSGRFEFNLTLNTGEYFVQAQHKNQNGMVSFHITEERSSYDIIITLK